MGISAAWAKAEVPARGPALSDDRTVAMVFAARLFDLADRVECQPRPETAREREGRRFSLRRWLRRLLRAGVAA